MRSLRLRVHLPGDSELRGCVAPHACRSPDFPRVGEQEVGRIVPFVYLPYLHFFFVPNSSPHPCSLQPDSYLLLYRCLMPQITTREVGKKTRGEQKMVKEGKTLAGLSLFAQQKTSGHPSRGLSVDTGLQKEQPAGWINTDEKW